MSVYTVKHASFYVKSRPRPSKEVIGNVIEYLSDKLRPNDGSNKWNLCIDVGCGSGQCTQLLSPYFDSVIGTDLHETQISEAKKGHELDNVLFMVSPAQKIPAADNTVDLVTCSQSMHWFNLDKFYPEVNRALKPNGVLAAFGYYNIPTVTVAGNEVAGKQLTENLRSTYLHKYLTQYAIPKLKAVDNGYIDLDFPFQDLTRIEGIKTSVDSTIGGLEHYVQAWSDYHRCYAMEPDSAVEVLELFKSNVLMTANEQELSMDTAIEMTFHNFLLMGRKQ